MEDRLIFAAERKEPKEWWRMWFDEPQPYLRARWIFLRGLGLIFVSAFYSLLFQIHGLIGARGILPVREYLVAAREAVGLQAYWLVPSLLWLQASDAALSVLVWLGLTASLTLTFNVLPRISIAVAGLCFLSFVAAAQDFSAYQSDSMLLEAALLSLFIAGRKPPSRAAVFMLQWLWFRIYVQSGIVKILSGEEQWRNLTAMDKYYENGPLPTTLAWYVQQWPHSFHAGTALLTLIVELGVVWLLFMGRRARLICFLIVTPLQIGIILTANYAFLNFLVLLLGILLLDDKQLRGGQTILSVLPSRTDKIVCPPLFLISLGQFFIPAIGLPLAPFRVINNYGLFAVMTRARYEIEFHGTYDMQNWTAYPFAYKPQNPREAPGFFAPYHPRLDWNLWFESLAPVPESTLLVTRVKQRLLENSPEVVRLFQSNPFATRAPTAVRVVVWRYWFTTHEERRRTGAYWNRELRR